MPEIWKKFKSEVMTTLKKEFDKIHKFWSLGLCLKLQVFSLGLDYITVICN